MEGPSELVPLESDDEEIPEHERYRDEEIAERDCDEEVPAWMDFSDEEIREEGAECPQKKVRKEMRIAWMVAKTEISKRMVMRAAADYDCVFCIFHGGRHVPMLWGKFSAEDELKVGWKDSEMDLLTELTFFIWRKKSRELDQAYALRKLKKAQEKGLQPDKELKHSKYLEFRNKWSAIHSCWGGVFEKITKICPMRYTHEHVPRYVCIHGPPDALQIFSVKVVGKSKRWPLHVFGLVAVRDSIDQHRNIIFNRQRDDCQTLTEKDPYLLLTGPTRVVVINDKSIPVTIEAELKVKGTVESEDKDLIFAVATLPFKLYSESKFYSESLGLVCSGWKLHISLEQLTGCVEATIFTRVIDGTWPLGFHGQLVAHTCVSNNKVVLVEFKDDIPVNDGGMVNQSRFVVAVEIIGKLVLSYKAWREGEVIQGDVAFDAEKRGRSRGILNIDSCTLEVIVVWSPIQPICEELVRSSETDLMDFTNATV